MSEHPIRRFTPIQIAYHWAQAIPYLALAVTGAVLLVQRLLGLESPAREALALVHKTAGIILIAMLVQTIAVAVVLRRFGELLQLLLEGLTWRWADLVWALKVPFNTLSSRVRLPPAGRLNAGQKVNLLVTAVVVPGFIASGLAMMLVPEALGPWILHVVLFVPAAAFLALHLFLALVNPETRKALGAMFTGYVSGEYARTHHARLASGDAVAAHGRLVSIGAVLATLIVAGAAIAWGLHTYGFDRLKARTAGVWARQGADAILPGALYADHQVDDRPGRCTACHRMFETIPDSACLACHEAIRQVMAAKQGYHGRLVGECRTCHTDHKGAKADIRGLDANAFNHALARYSLNGRHGDVACEACHLHKAEGGGSPRIAYIGLEFAACTACHENPHDLPPEEPCERCHTPAGWKEPHILFDHDRDSRFLLDGRHATIACEKCHAREETGGKLVALRFHEAGTHCLDCHDDPHGSALGVECAKCHGALAWGGRELRFDHNRDSRFRLTGEHTALGCDECHRLQKGKSLGTAHFKGLGATCADCHEDPHGGQFSRPCGDCHSEHGWTGRWVVDAHGRGSDWPLLGKHRLVACSQCHTPPGPGAKLATAQFVGTPQTCAGCHTDPHEGQMRSTCVVCHSEQGWEGRHLLFSHDQHAVFSIDRLHASVGCTECHGGGEKPTYRPLPQTCEGCHRTIEEALAGVTEIRRAAPDPHWGRVTCTECHPRSEPPRAPADYAHDCRSCHNEHYEGLFYDWMKALGARRARAQRLLEAQRAAASPDANALAPRIRLATAVGSHNIQLARELWDDLVASPPAPAGRSK